ncbi:RNA polymerase sigma factor [Leucobacter sp. HY1908]
MSQEFTKFLLGREIVSLHNFEGLSDAVLVARAVDGDRCAFAALLRRYAPLMSGYARKLTCSNADADDAVQEAFITAWHALDSLENHASVKSWLMRIVGHKAIDRTRARPTNEPLTEFNAPASRVTQPERHVEVASQLQEVAHALDALPDLQRQAWLLRELAGYSYLEIAGELGVPVSTVRGAIARARSALLRGMGGWT